MKSSIVRRRKLAASGIAILLATSVFGLAIAQQTQPIFRHKFSAATMSPPTSPSGGDMDFSRPGSETSYTLRGLVGDNLSLQMTTRGGVAPVTWLPSPALPAGLGFGDGLISGRPDAVNASSALFEARDGSGNLARGRVTFELYEAAVSISQLRSVVRLGSPFYGLISSNVSGASYTISRPGMTVSAPDAQSRSVLGGNATELGAFPVRVDVSKPGTAVSAYVETSVTVASPLAISFNPSSLSPIPTGISVTATPQNVVGTATLETLTPAATLATRGLTYANGVLSGSLTGGSAIALVLRLTDSADGQSVTASYDIPAISNQPATIVVNAGGRLGQPLNASPGSASPATIVTSVPNPVCTVTQAVPGVTVSSSCQISGAPNTPGQFTLGVNVVPASNPAATPIATSATVTVYPALAASGSNFTGQPGEQATIVVSTSGVIGQPTFSTSDASQAELSAAGLTFDTTSGSVSGIVGDSVSIAYTVKVTDTQDGASVSRFFTVESGPATVTPAAAVTVRSGATKTLAVSTTIRNPEFSIVSGPSYVTVDAQTGTLSVTGPVVSASQAIPPVTLRATAKARPSVSKTAVVSMGTIRPAMAISIAPSTTIRANDFASIPFTTSGATRPYVEIRSGGVPTGMTLKQTVIDGTPTTAQAYPFALRLYDEEDMSTIDLNNLQIVVTPGIDFTLSSAASQVGKGDAGKPMTITAAAQNAVGAITFSNVPISGRTALLSSANLSISAQGVITGTPSGAFQGTANIRLTENNNGVVKTVDKALVLDIAPLPAATALTDLPVITGSSDSQLMAKLYDRDPYDALNSLGAKSNLIFASSTKLTYTFSRPVTINGLAAESLGQHLADTQGVKVILINKSLGQPKVLINDSVLKGHLSFEASTGTTFEIEYRNPCCSPPAVAKLALTYDGGHVAYPHISNSMTLSRNGAAAAPFELGNVRAIRAKIGEQIVVTPAVFDAVGPVTWSHLNPLPAGTSLDKSTGVISGAPTTSGTPQVTLYATDSRSLTSVGHTIQFYVDEAETAATVMPVLSGVSDPTRDRVALYDADTFDTTAQADGSSSVTLAVNQTVTFTFPTPTRVNQLGLTAAATAGNPAKIRVEMRNVDQNAVLVPTSRDWATSGYVASFTDAGPSRTFTVRNASTTPLTLSELKLLFNNRFVNVPTVSESLLVSMDEWGFKSAGLRSKVVTIQGQTTTIRPAATSFPFSTFYTWAMSGEIPPGMNFDAATGTISGVPTTIGEFTVSVAATDTDGYTSIAKPVRISVGALDTVATGLPTISGVADPTLALRALYDFDPYEITLSGPSTYNVQTGDVITLTYDRPRRTNQITVARAYPYNSVSLSVQVTNRDTGVVLSNLNIKPTGVSGTIDFPETQSGQVFDIRFTTGSPMAIANLALMYNFSAKSFGAVSETIAVGKNNGSLTYPSIRTRIDATNGQNLRIKAFTSGEVLTNWVFTGLPSSMTFDAVTGEATGPASGIGDYSVTVKATGPAGLETFSKPISIRISP